MKIIDGGVTAAKGFKAASTAAEIKYKGRTDMAMVFSEVPCVAAGTFTTNVVKAAPVRWGSGHCIQPPGCKSCDLQQRNRQRMYRRGRISAIAGKQPRQHPKALGSRKTAYW